MVLLLCLVLQTLAVKAGMLDGFKRCLIIYSYR